MPRRTKSGPAETRAGTGPMQTVPRFMQLAIHHDAGTVWALDIHGRVWELRNDGWHRETARVGLRGWEDPGADNHWPTMAEQRRWKERE